MDNRQSGGRSRGERARGSSDRLVGREEARGTGAADYRGSRRDIDLRRDQTPSGIGYGYGLREYGDDLSYSEGRAPGAGRGVWSRQITEQDARSGRGPRGYSRSDDRIREDVCDGIIASGIDASDVEVTVEGGLVTLTGSVGDRSEKHRMEDIADSVGGVGGVRSEIRVRR